MQCQALQEEKPTLFDDVNQCRQYAAELATMLKQEHPALRIGFRCVKTDLKDI
jgi:hypothetical protein